MHPTNTLLLLDGRDAAELLAICYPPGMAHHPHIAYPYTVSLYIRLASAVRRPS